MNGPAEHPVTLLLAAARRGDAGAAEKLFPAVYDELREVARRKLERLPPGQTLQATALVNEAYLRLAGGSSDWESRAHFFGAAARAMRNILVERYRRMASEKRGGGRARADLDAAAVAANEPDVDLAALDEALKLLEQYDRRKCEVVMLRYFAGLSIDETAQALSTSTATVERDWAVAKAWLARTLEGGA